MRDSRPSDVRGDLLSSVPSVPALPKIEEQREPVPPQAQAAAPSPAAPALPSSIPAFDAVAAMLSVAGSPQEIPGEQALDTSIVQQNALPTEERRSSPSVTEPLGGRTWEIFEPQRSSASQPGEAAPASAPANPVCESDLLESYTEVALSSLEAPCDVQLVTRSSPEAALLEPLAPESDILGHSPVASLGAIDTQPTKIHESRLALVLAIIVLAASAGGGGWYVGWVQSRPLPLPHVAGPMVVPGAPRAVPPAQMAPSTPEPAPPPDAPAPSSLPQKNTAAVHSVKAVAAQATPPAQTPERETMWPEKHVKTAQR
jgi:hypothetical protein